MTSDEYVACVFFTLVICVCALGLSTAAWLSVQSIIVTSAQIPVFGILIFLIGGGSALLIRALWVLLAK